WRGPLVEAVPLLGLVYFFGKIILSLFFMIWLRSTHPRLRYDQLMALGWKVLLPMALANVVVTAAALLDRTLLLVVVGVLAVILVALIISAYRRAARRERARKDARVLTAAQRGA
ncbi:MAG: NADH-quinone oxidoreductase subunit H, partial [Anaerolineales bacterium]